MKLCFNLRREANPLATVLARLLAVPSHCVSISGEKPIPWRPYRAFALGNCWYVSISGEKPIPWRLAHQVSLSTAVYGFNLRREANPLAT